MLDDVFLNVFSVSLLFFFGHESMCFFVIEILTQLKREERGFKCLNFLWLLMYMKRGICGFG